MGVAAVSLAVGLLGVSRSDGSVLAGSRSVAAHVASGPWASFVWAPVRFGSGKGAEYFFYVSIRCGGGANAAYVHFARFPIDNSCSSKATWAPGFGPVAPGKTYVVTAWAVRTGPVEHDGPHMRYSLAMPGPSSIAWLGCGKACRLPSQP